MRRRALRDRVAGVLLRGFGASEVDEVVRDLNELASDRGPVRGTLYFWSELLKYPAWAMLDRLRHGEGLRDVNSREWGDGMGSIRQDIVYALRSLARNRGFAALAVTIMAVSMGSATAMFSVVKGVLLDPIPVEEPDRLVSFWLAPVEGAGRARMTPATYLDIASLDDVFSHAAAFSGRTSSLSVDDASVFLRGGAVTTAYFETLGVRPITGRTFQPEEGEDGGAPVVVLSHHVWQTFFGSDPSLVGRSIRLDGSDFLVVGVVPTGVYPTHATVSAEIPFTASNQDFFVPLRYGTEGWANRRSHILGAIGRLSSGTQHSTADAAVGTLSARLQQTEPLSAGERIVVTPFTEEVVGDVRLALFTLLGSVALVLLIAVTNVGALFVLRMDDRRHEMRIRAALGAPRFRLLRQLVVESVLIVGASALGAMVLAGVGLDLMKRLVPYQVPRLGEVTIDGSALGANLSIALLVGTAFAVAPALLGGPLSGAARRSTTLGRGQRRLQGIVVGLQAGLAVVVLVGATLFTRSYAALRAVDTGFDARESWTMSVPTDLPTLEEIVRRVRQLPGVAAAAIAYDHPLSRSWGDSFRITGQELSDTDAPPAGSLRPFGEAYFEAAGITVVEGRVPDRVDLEGPVPYAVINESLRDRWFPDGDALGSTIILPTAQRILGTDGAFEVVGVVRDVRFLGPDQPVGPALYVPLTHFQVSATTLLVRPETPGTDVMSGVRRVVRDTDQSVAVQRAQLLGDVLDDLLGRPRFNMMLLLAFGAMALVLCGLGAYGLMRRVVVARFREIGIRKALGADRAGLARAVLGSALHPLAAGCVLGAVVAYGISRVLRVALFEVSATDPVSLVAGPAFVLVIGALAALAPTLRALKISPAVTLREE